MELSGEWTVEEVGRLGSLSIPGARLAVEHLDLCKGSLDPVILPVHERHLKQPYNVLLYRQSLFERRQAPWPSWLLGRRDILIRNLPAVHEPTIAKWCQGSLVGHRQHIDTRGWALHAHAASRSGQVVEMG